jgi:transcription initiation factor TFIIB
VVAVVRTASTTVIGRENKDARGQTIDTAMRSKMERLRTWDARTRMRNPRDRNLMKAFGLRKKYQKKISQLHQE